MKEIKKKYFNIIEQMEAICLKNEMTKEIIEEIIFLKTKMENFKILLPLIGNFNAGKSSILNAFLNEEFLPTNIRPETAIASEIVYGKTKEIKAYKEDGSFDIYNLSQIKSIDASKYIYISISMNNDFLYNNQDIVFVDMPGLDSGLEIHNKAILQYIKNGVNFVIIIDVEDGSIRKSTLNFLKEIKRYNLEVLILINKIDKKPQSEIIEIKNSIERQASQYFENIFVGLISANDNNISDFFKIIENVNQKKCFRTEFENKVLTIIESMITELNIRMNSLNVSSSDIEKTIKELMKSKEKLAVSMKNEEEKISARFSTESVNNILSKVKQNLRSNSSLLVNALQVSEGAFKNEINEILRPALIEATDANIKIVFDEAISNIDEKFNDSTNSINKLFEISRSKSPDLLNGINLFSESLKISGDKLASKEYFLTSKMGVAYKSIAGVIGISTAIVAPWLEVIIIFLPEIIQVFSKLFGEGNIQNEMKRKIEFEIIPQIVSKLRPKIKEGLANAKESFMEDLNKEMEKKHIEIVSALEKAIQEKQVNETKTVDEQNLLKQSISELLELSSEIQEV